MTFDPKRHPIGEAPVRAFVNKVFRVLRLGGELRRGGELELSRELREAFRLRWYWRDMIDPALFWMCEWPHAVMCLSDRWINMWHEWGSERTKPLLRATVAHEFHHYVQFLKTKKWIYGPEVEALAEAYSIKKSGLPSSVVLDEWKSLLDEKRASSNPIKERWVFRTVEDKLLYETEPTFIPEEAHKEAEEWLKGAYVAPERKFGEYFEILWKDARFVRCVIYKKEVKKAVPWTKEHVTVVQVRRKCGYREKIADIPAGYDLSWLVPVAIILTMVSIPAIWWITWAQPLELSGFNYV